MPRREHRHVELCDNCWGRVKFFCRQSLTICAEMKRKLTMQLRNKFDNFILSRPELRAEDRKSIMLHIRGGDRARKYLNYGLDLYAQTLHHIYNLTRLRQVLIFCELASDAAYVKETLFFMELKKNHLWNSVTFVVGGDPVESWSRMVQGAVLLVGPSSFSLSAASFRAGPTFSIVQCPIDGRYDDNKLPCTSTIFVFGKRSTVYYDLGHGTSEEDCLNKRWT